MRVVLIALLVVVLCLVFRPQPQPQPADIMILVALTYIGVGFAEEYSFRGVLMRVFRDRLGMVWAAVVVSLLFSTAHWGEWFYHEHVPFGQLGMSFLAFFVSGMLFTVMAWRSGSISWAALVHALNDVQAQTSAFTWQQAWTLMVCGVIGAELLRFASKVMSAR
ncbi:CPBP family intramembrane glutamic endopeptidase [Alicyclobacillus kakegawensis]|uniref:CPBP family intramembrane glutamic endopeptidase n=1 Tax=Alicyclobacillus kakegawensis TaxID=392012 RepID=UPI0014705FA4|nr:CPBP family intramembrane glutamic endopeptidase [Alicyclobacillus kakegawensis]